MVVVLVEIGDFVTRYSPLLELGECINVKSLDNRASVFILVETLRALKKFVDVGGTVVALEQLPSASAGLRDWEQHDQELKRLVGEIFPANSAPKGGGVFLPEYKLDPKPFNPMRQPYTVSPPLTAPQRQLLAALDRGTPPDFTLAGRAQSDGLTFIHKRSGDVDVYFVCNLEPTRIATEVTFRVTGKTLQRWDGITGQVSPVSDFRADANGTTLALEFEPWESAFFVFAPGVAPARPAKPAAVASLPQPLPIAGTWRMKLEGFGFETFEADATTLASWTDSPRTRHFSGTGRYEIEFDLPAGHFAKGANLVLDLGQVGNIAEVELNGQPVGVAWMAPHRLDVTRAARAGKNKLVVQVTNTLINYVTGLQAPPEVPLELQPRLGKANPEIYPQSNLARREMSETDLPLSGLVGPVKIVATLAP